MFEVTRFHHASLIVKNTDQALVFYRDLLNLKVISERPDLGYAGAWLDLGSGQQLHLLELDNPDSTENRPEHGGRDRHLALSVKSLDLLENKLSQAKIAYTLSRSGRAALFCRDPDGNALEFIEQKT